MAAWLEELVTSTPGRRVSGRTLPPLPDSSLEWATTSSSISIPFPPFASLPTLPRPLFLLRQPSLDDKIFIVRLLHFSLMCYFSSSPSFTLPPLSSFPPRKNVLWPRFGQNRRVNRKLSARLKLRQMVVGLTVTRFPV